MDTFIRSWTAFKRILGSISLRKVGIFLVSIVLFIIALEFMKSGARELAPFITQTLDITNPTNSLGFGWFSSYLVMSGSPIAATALTFLDVDVITAASAFTMITGSRLGASIIVLIIGLVYLLRGHEQGTSLITGLLTLVVTATVYLPALPVGLWLVESGILVVELNMQGGGGSPFTRALTAPVTFAEQLLPAWAVFGIGLIIIVFSLNLFDKALPEVNLEESVFGGINRLLYRPIVIFSLGFGITLLTMSVSVSLGLLVPLSVRGYIRRENLLPYIMGCNVSTFIDTLVAGLLLGNPIASSVVLAQMISVAVISSVIILAFFTPYERTVLRFVLWLNSERKRLIAFFILMIVTPITLVLVL